jgi:DNA-binding IclR family transcriptional regulator
LNKIPKYPVKSLDKALSILDLIHEEGGNLPLSEIASRLRFEKGTVHRMLQTLQARRFIQQDPVTRKYGLGDRSIELGSRIDKNKVLRSTLEPHLKKILEKCKETVWVVVLEGDEAKCIVRSEPDKFLKVTFQEGCRLPAHCTGGGRILLAGLTDEAVRKLYDGEKTLKKLTPKSIGTLESLMKALKQIRNEDVDFEYDQVSIGANCVSAPIRNLQGQIVAAISISGPKERMSKVKMMEYSEVLKEAVKRISEELPNNFTCCG